MALFFEANRMVIHFGYGLVFFLLGFVVALAARAFGESRLAITRSLTWLAGFGLMVGLAEWGVVFIPLQAVYLSAGWLEGLRLLQMLLLVAGHACLLGFGLKLTAEWESPRWLLATTLAVGLLLLAWHFLAGGLEPHWQSGARALAAYGLGLPGAVLGARGLLLQARDLAPFYARPARALVVAAWAFMLSVPIGPLAVPFSGQRGYGLLGLPVELFLAAGGLWLTWSLFSGLEALKEENARRLERAERREAMAEERYRLSKELNDGVIQDLFAAGMLLGAVRSDLPQNAGEELVVVERHLQTVVGRLRGYVITLDPARWRSQSLQEGLEQLVADFRANALIPVAVEFDLDGAGLGQGPEPAASTPGQVGSTLGQVGSAATNRELLCIVHEALSNVRRHSGATQASLLLRQRGAELLLQITDNGRGIRAELERGPGLEQMYRSAALLGGRLEVGRAPGGGTLVHLSAPVITNDTSPSEQGA